MEQPFLLGGAIGALLGLLIGLAFGLPFRGNLPLAHGLRGLALLVLVGFVLGGLAGGSLLLQFGD